MRERVETDHLPLSTKGELALIDSSNQSTIVVQSRRSHHSRPPWIQASEGIKLAVIWRSDAVQSQSFESL